MISEGSSGSDIVYTLCDGSSSPRSRPKSGPLKIYDAIGILKIEMGREVFERTGLPGKPIRSGGRKHGKDRYCKYNGL